MKSESVYMPYIPVVTSINFNAKKFIIGSTPKGFKPTYYEKHKEYQKNKGKLK